MPRRKNLSPFKTTTSIQDVARSAGVSTATVSRVLNSPDLVADETAQKVRRAVAELGYKPNLFAKGLMTRKSQVLGIALPDLHGEFYSALLHGADDEARRHGYQLLVSTDARRNAGRTDDAPPGSAGDLDLTFGIVEGIALMITQPADELLRRAQSTGLPLVVMDAEVKGNGTPVDSVLIDNVVGTVEATSHLAATTPRERIYFVGGPEGNFDTRTRAEAFAATLKGHGRAPAPMQMAYKEYTEAWGYEWAERANREGRLRTGAVLCADDEIAVGVLQAAEDMGLTVGPAGDVRIVGFDDTRIASIVRPKLSSVRVPLSEVGAGAVRLLLQRIEDSDAAPQVLRLPTRLVIRQSS
ncbi:MAG: LacI family transcriptional regulator [Phycisphaerales bacterium]|nr:LacI family transcriptional regulator [Phycisphaerales bacterium]